ncbi:MAG: DUF3140 domain-containing protein [Beijerinckiaceae bacterium]
MSIDRAKTAKDFIEAVNMSPAEIEHWLKTEESKKVGFTRVGESESVGRQSGRRIVAIKRKKRADLTDADYVHMRKVVGYVRRHTAQRPAGDISFTRWRYSLMNWGHDPQKT